MIWIRKGELMKKNITKTLFWLLVLALAFIFLVPMLYAVYNSLLPLDKVNHIVSPTEFTLNNYVDLFTDYPIARWFINTVIVAVITLICQLVTALLAGYALAKLRFPGRNLSFLIVLVTLMIPFQVLLTPLYIIISGLGWNDTLTGLIVPFMLNTLYVFMARQYYVTIPGELMEAARIDGLGYIGSYFQIVLPLSKPIIATITIFNFVQSWNAYLVPSTFVSSKAKFTLVVGLNTLKDTYFNRLNLTMAGVVVICIPILVLFLLLQKQLMRGIASDGIKG